MKPSTRAVPPARSTSASSMQSPPARAEATRVIILSPVFARPGAPPRSRCFRRSWGRPRRRARVAGRISPALATRPVVVEGDLDAVGWLRGSIYRVLLFWDRFSVSKPLSQIQRRTLLFLQQASYTPSFGGLGLNERFLILFRQVRTILKHVRLKATTKCSHTPQWASHSFLDPSLSVGPRSFSSNATAWARGILRECRHVRPCTVACRCRRPLHRFPKDCSPVSFPHKNPKANSVGQTRKIRTRKIRNARPNYR